MVCCRRPEVIRMVVAMVGARGDCTNGVVPPGWLMLSKATSGDSFRTGIFLFSPWLSSVT